MRQTNHGYARLGNRAGIGSVEEADRFAAEALETGLRPTDFPKGTELRHYIDCKSHGQIVRVHKGMVVVLSANTSALLTAYPLPAPFLREYKEIKKRKNQLL